MKTQETEHSNNVKTLEEKINAIKKVHQKEKEDILEQIKINESKHNDFKEGMLNDSKMENNSNVNLCDSAWTAGVDYEDKEESINVNKAHKECEEDNKNNEDECEEHEKIMSMKKIIKIMKIQKLKIALPATAIPVLQTKRVRMIKTFWMMLKHMKF